MKSRFEILQELVSRDENDSFSRYGLALELVKQNEKDKAIVHFLELIKRDSDYVPAYYQLAKTYELLENYSEAFSVYEKGMSVAKKKNDFHALSELQEAKDELTEGIS